MRWGGRTKRGEGKIGGEGRGNGREGSGSEREWEVSRAKNRWSAGRGVWVRREKMAGGRGGELEGRTPPSFAASAWVVVGVRSTSTSSPTSLRPAFWKVLTTTLVR